MDEAGRIYRVARPVELENHATRHAVLENAVNTKRNVSLRALVGMDKIQSVVTRMSNEGRASLRPHIPAGGLYVWCKAKRGDARFGGTDRRQATLDGHRMPRVGNQIHLTHRSADIALEARISRVEAIGIGANAARKSALLVLSSVTFRRD